MSVTQYTDFLFQLSRWEITFGLVALLLAYLFDVHNRIFRRNYPPGPRGIPLLGYLPFLTKNAHLDLMELGRKYDAVFSLQMGSESVIVITGPEAAREALNKAEFLGRPPKSAFRFFRSDSPFFSSGIETWQEQRRFVVQAMKDLGLGRSKIEEDIVEEIKYFMNFIRKTGGEPVDLIPYLTPSMSNNICSLVFGQRYEYDEPERLFMDESLQEGSRFIGQTAAHIFFPWIKYFPFLLKIMKYDEAKMKFNKLMEYFNQKVRYHQESLDENNIRDFIDRYLVEMRLRKEKNPNTTFSDEMLSGTVSDLFGAGTETVRTTVRWCFYIMAAFPNVQKKVQREILEVVGSEKFPEFQDRKNMPFTQAVIMEVMRWKTIVPLNLLRYTTDDVKVGGYDVPKDTIVMVNFWAVHHDPETWKDPENFVPERFLSPDEKTLIKSENFIPFSLGRRICPGETMATMEVFLYFVSMLQSFNISLPDGVEPTFDAELTITYRLNPHKLRLIQRS